MAETQNSSGGIGFFGLLQIVLIVMKLAEVGAVASWSWWWVWSPTIASFAIAGAFLGVALIAFLAAALLGDRL